MSYATLTTSYNVVAGHALRRSRRGCSNASSYSSSGSVATGTRRDMHRHHYGILAKTGSCFSSRSSKQKISLRLNRPRKLVDKVKLQAAEFSSAAPVVSERITNDDYFWEPIAAATLALASSAAIVSLSLLHPTPFLVQDGGNSGGGNLPPDNEPPGSNDTSLIASLFLAGVPMNKQADTKLSEEKLPLRDSTKAFTDSRRVYDISKRAIKGVRVTMEDEYYVANGGRFASVFDGHGGGGVSNFLKRRLYRELLSSLRNLHEGEAAKSNAPPSVACHAAALREAFHRIEESVMNNDELHYQGSTAVAIWVHDDEAGHRTVLSANVGDSRAILSRKGEAIDLTRDHKPNEDREKARIMAMGETIEWDRSAKVHRVRNLSLSRAIGDRYAKPVVSGEVEIQRFPVIDDGDEFILLASDGLWDVMSSQDVVSYVHKRIAREMDDTKQVMSREEMENYKLVLRKNMAKHVAFEAFRRGSGDNICVVMVWLDDNRRLANTD